MKYYRVRDKRTGLFKGPGYYGKFSKEGKVWNQKTIRNSMTSFFQYPNHPKLSYDHLEVVEYELVEKESFDFTKFYNKTHK